MAPTALYTLSLHDALPISCTSRCAVKPVIARCDSTSARRAAVQRQSASSPTGSPTLPAEPRGPQHPQATDRKSTRLNSSHSQISYAVFCLKKKQKNNLVTV